MNEYIIGNDAVCEGKFRNVQGQLADPTTVIFQVRDPSANLTEYTYPAPQIVKIATGIYRTVVDCDEAGEWQYKYKSTGTGKAADEGEFRVLTSSFP